MQTILLSLWVLQANLVFADTLQHGRLRLDAAMGQPVMLANKKEVACLNSKILRYLYVSVLLKTKLYCDKQKIYEY